MENEFEYLRWGWGGGTCLKVPKGWVGVFGNFRKVPMVLFCHKKERGVPKQYLKSTMVLF